jgi:hypothetical protein
MVHQGHPTLQPLRGCWLAQVTFAYATGPLAWSILAFRYEFNHTLRVPTTHHAYANCLQCGCFPVALIRRRNLHVAVEHLLLEMSGLNRPICQ